MIELDFTNHNDPSFQSIVWVDEPHGVYYWFTGWFSGGWTVTKRRLTVPVSQLRDHYREGEGLDSWNERTGPPPDIPEFDRRRMETML